MRRKSRFSGVNDSGEEQGQTRDRRARLRGAGFIASRWDAGSARGRFYPGQVRRWRSGLYPGLFSRHPYGMLLDALPWSARGWQFCDANLRI